MRLRLLLFIAALLGLAASPLFAQQPVSHQTLSVTSAAAVGLDPSTTSPSGAGAISSCVIAVEGAPIRYWVDGGAPTSTSGFLVSVGGYFLLPSYSAAVQFQAIAPGATATLQASCTRGGGGPTPMAFDPSLQHTGMSNANAAVQLLGGVDASGTIRAAAVTQNGAVAVTLGGGLPVPPCNPVLRTNCR